MKLFYTSSFIISVVSLSSFSSASAQFTGGSGDGVAYTTGISTLALGRNIFAGGNDDGSTMYFANSPLGRNIFTGGADDGNTMYFANSPLGRNIFTGGNDDGNATSLASNSALGRNIFTGGNDDGFSSSLNGIQPLGRNIFTGGNDDGWAMAFTANLLLPVTFLSFTGQWSGNDAALSWQTGSEANTAYFELQRSLDGSQFTTIQQLAAAGQSSEARNYACTDKGIKNLLGSGNRVYYRLCTVDKNGGKTYSAIVVLTTVAGNDIIYAVFPNPARDVVTVTCSAVPTGGSADLVVMDANGKILIRQRMTGNRQQLSVASFAAGTYFLSLYDKGAVIYRQKIIVIK